MSLSLWGIILISTWARKLIVNALTGCSVNFDHIFDPINTFQIQLPVFHSLLGSLRGIWCKIIYIVALVSPIWDIFSAQSGWEGVVSGLTTSSGSISQLGRWCQLGIWNSESTDVGDGFHKRKKQYVTGYHTCIYFSTFHVLGEVASGNTNLALAVFGCLWESLIVFANDWVHFGV